MLYLINKIINMDDLIRVNALLISEDELDEDLKEEDTDEEGLRGGDDNEEDGYYAWEN